MGSSFPADSEKRVYVRRQIWFPVTLRREAGEVWAICRDASAGGLLVSAAAGLAVDEPITAAFCTRPGGAEQEAVARVVRVLRNPDDDLALAFPFRIALAFEAPIPELGEELGTPQESDRHV